VNTSVDYLSSQNLPFLTRKIDYNHQYLIQYRDQRRLNIHCPPHYTSLVFDSQRFNNSKSSHHNSCSFIVNNQGFFDNSYSADKCHHNTNNLYWLWIFVRCPAFIISNSWTAVSVCDASLSLRLVAWSGVFGGRDLGFNWLVDIWQCNAKDSKDV